MNESFHVFLVSQPPALAHVHYITSKVQKPIILCIFQPKRSVMPQPRRLPTQLKQIGCRNSRVVYFLWQILPTWDIYAQTFTHAGHFSREGRVEIFPHVASIYGVSSLNYVITVVTYSP